MRDSLMTAIVERIHFDRNAKVTASITIVADGSSALINIRILRDRRMEGTHRYGNAC